LNLITFDFKALLNHLGAPTQQTRVGRSRSQASDRFDELNHLAALNRSGAVLVELAEALVEVIIVEASAVGHVREGVLHELLGLFLVESTAVVDIVLAPDLVDALANDCIDLTVRVAVVRHLLFG
jgi:hypothetical protein